MFCKYCGADFPDTAKKCPRCGEASPAKSDCGGFYDLVHLTPKKAAAPAENPVGPVAPAPVPEKKGFFPLGYDLFAMIVSGIMLLLLIMNIVLLAQIGKVNRMAEENAAAIGSLGNDMDNIDDKTPEGTQPEGTVPEDTQPEQTKPEEDTQNKKKPIRLPEGWNTSSTAQDITVSTILAAEGSKLNIALYNKDEQTPVTAGTFSGEALGNAVSFGENGFLSGIQFDLDTEGEGYDFKLVVENTKTEDGKALITVKVEELSQLIFGARDGKLKFQWQYRKLTEDQEPGEWKTITKSEFELDPTYDPEEHPNDDFLTTGLLYTAECLNCELQLVITRENTTEGNLTVTIDGMAITQAVLDAVLPQTNETN